MRVVSDFVGGGYFEWRTGGVLRRIYIVENGEDTKSYDAGF